MKPCSSELRVLSTFRREVVYLLTKEDSPENRTVIEYLKSRTADIERRL